jgi:hypothetical protein
MSSGHAAFDAYIAGVESLRTLNEQVAKAAEAGVKAAARASADAAETPSGEEWPELADGGKALRGAGAAIESSTKRNRIDLKIGKPFVFHNHGAGGSSTTKEAVRQRKRAAAERAKSGTTSKFHAPRRQILPVAGEPIPETMTAAIEEAAAGIFGKAMGG